MGYLLVDDGDTGRVGAGEAALTPDHLCPADRPILIRSYPQGEMLVTVWICDFCYPEWADADLSEVLS